MASTNPTPASRKAALAAVPINWQWLIGILLSFLPQLLATGEVWLARVLAQHLSPAQAQLLVKLAADVVADQGGA